MGNLTIRKLISTLLSSCQNIDDECVVKIMKREPTLNGIIETASLPIRHINGINNSICVEDSEIVFVPY